MGFRRYDYQTKRKSLSHAITRKSEICAGARLSEKAIVRTVVVDFINL